MQHTRPNKTSLPAAILVLCLSLYGYLPLPAFAGTLIAKGKAKPLQAQAIKTPVTPSRTVYILHGGMSDPDNKSPQNIEKYILSRGVVPADVIVLPNPYPAIPPDFTNLPDVKGKDRNKNIGNFIKNIALEAKDNSQDNWQVYKHTLELDSDVTQATYHNLLSQLQEKKSQNPTLPLNIVWVGLSAGGQMGLTMSQLMARDNPDFQFKTIVTIGSPVVHNEAPAAVQIICNISDQDQVLMQTTRPGYAKVVVGQDIKKVPPNMDANDEVRQITMKLSKKYDVTEGHNLWHKNTTILAQALKGVVP